MSAKEKSTYGLIARGYSLIERGAALPSFRKATNLLDRLPGDRTLWIIAALLIVSFLARAAYLVFVWGVDAPLIGDEPDYHGYATSFVDGDGWRNGGDRSARSPLLPLQLVAIYSLVGPETGIARWYMAVVSAAMAPLVFLLARQLYPQRLSVAILAAMAWALYPPAIWYASRIFTESMAALLVVAGVGAYISAARSRSPWLAVLTGVIWGLAVMNRSSFLLLPVAMLFIQLLFHRARPSVRWELRQWLVALVAVVLVMAPWTVRNYLVHGVFLPTESRAGYVLLQSNGRLDDPLIRSGAYAKDHLGDLAPLISQGESEVEQDNIMRGLALDEIRRNWRLLPRVVLNRAKNFWTTRPDPYDPNWTFNDTVMLLVWVPALLFFLSSSYLRSWRQNWPALTVVMYVFLMTLPFWGTPRFRFPVDAILITGAAVGFAEFASAAFGYLGRKVRVTRRVV